MLGDALRFVLDGSNWAGTDGMLRQLVQQLLLTGASMLIVIALGLPLALWLGHLGKGGTFAINLSNIGRAVPVYAVLALLSLGFVGSGVLGPFGRAGLATLISLILFALPPIVTNAYVGMREIDREIIETARGMGMSEWRILSQVELPLAFPLVLTGIRLALVQVWATATIAALVAGPGLGNTITYGYNNGQFEYVLGGAIVVAAVALVLEGVVVVAERAADPMRRAYRQSRTSIAQNERPLDKEGALL